MLSIRRVRKVFAGAVPRLVLNEVSLELGAGEYVAILGESGVGKSTLLNLIAGLDRPDSGSIVVDGLDLATLDDDSLTRLRRRRIGFVFQAFHVLPYLSVRRNVELPLLLLGGPSPTGPRVDAMLAAVGLLGRAESMPRELSGGELQRVAIARALVHEPGLLLADEPTGNLDPATAAEMTGLMARAVRAQGAAGILVTHSMEAAARADRVYRLTPSGLAAA